MNDVSSELALRELQLLRAEVANLQELLRAITSGDVDAVVVGAAGESQLYGGATAARPYRLIVEEMGEGAALISASGLILYVNKRLAQLLDCQIKALGGHCQQ